MPDRPKFTSGDRRYGRKANRDKAEDVPCRAYEDIPTIMREEYANELCGVLVQLTEGGAREMTTI